jgi:peptidoglycan/LPS O-acetylase OafA/YrhL
MPPARIYTLDYLRGINACFIMLYHCIAWAVGIDFADTGSAWVRFSALRVPLFYALGGCTLCHVYYRQMAPSWRDAAQFYKKRFLRLYPMLWVTLAAAVYFYFYLVDGNTLDWEQAALNFTGLFGFVAWDRHLSAGVWSVGNVLVFSVLFPLIVLLAKRCKPLFALLGMAVFAVFLYFTFVKLQPESATWGHDSTNPLNQLFLFFGGFCIPLALSKIGGGGGGGKNLKINNMIAFALIILAIACFLLFPTGGATPQAGINRVAFTGCCLLICAGAYAMRFRAPGALHAPLSWLGKASYSIFLLHPVVYWAVVNGSLPPATRIATVVAVTLALSAVTHRWVEEFFVKLGKRTKSVALHT